MFFSKSLNTTFKVSIILLVMTIALLNIIPLTNEKTHREIEMSKNIKNALNLQYLFIENWLDERVIMLETLSSLPSVKTGNKESMFSVFQQFISNSKSFSAMVYVNEDGIVQLDTGGTISSTVDLSDREYFIEAKKGNAHITDVIISRNTGVPSIIFSVPIYNYDEEFQGLLFGTVSLATIEQMMNQFEIGETGKTFLIDKNGIFIKTHQENEDYRYTGTVLSDHLKLAKHDIAFDKYYKNHHNVAVMGHYQWVNNRNWIIVGEIEKNEVLMPFYKTTMMMLGISFVVLYIAYLFLLKLIYKRIHAPIEYVLVGAKLIISGEYNTHQIKKAVIDKSPTELKELCDVYNQMSATISTKINELKEYQESLRQSEAYLSNIVEIIPNGVVILDISGQITFANTMAQEILGLNHDEITSRYYNDEKWRITTLDGKPFPSELFPFVQAVEKKIPVHNIEHMIIKNDGASAFLSINVTPLFDRNHEVNAVVSSIVDITERTENEQRIKEANQFLQKISMKDGLTGVSNRRHYDEMLAKEWKLHVLSEQPLSIIIFDIDHFKIFNDTYGHQNGDDCLITIANTVDMILKKQGYFLARYGGEEFVSILPETSSEEAVKVAEEIRVTVENIGIENKNSPVADVVTICVGVATVIADENGLPAQLFNNADKALYKGKRTGRNQVNLFNK